MKAIIELSSLAVVAPVVLSTLPAQAGDESDRLADARTPDVPGPEAPHALSGLVTEMRMVRRGGYLFRQCDSFHGLYWVRQGHVKLQRGAVHRGAQVNGLLMTGDLAGCDGLDTGRHRHDAVALDDCEVSLIPYVRGQSVLPREQARVELHRLIGSQIHREQAFAALLGNLKSEQRLAAFLVNLASRRGAGTESGLHAGLTMKRDEIASYLGLPVEAIIRLIDKFRRRRLLVGTAHAIQITDLQRLRDLACADISPGR